MPKSAVVLFAFISLIYFSAEAQSSDCASKLDLKSEGFAQALLNCLKEMESGTNVVAEGMSKIGQAPATENRPTTGTNPNAPNTGFGEAVCPDGQYVAGRRGWGAFPGVRYCVGCFVAVQVICKPFIN